MNRRVCVPLILTIALYAKTLYWMVGSWIMNPYYSHGILVLAVSVFLLRRCGFEWNPSPKGIAVFAVSLLVHTIATYYSLYFLSAFSFPFAIYGVLRTFYSFDPFPILFLLFAVPYPVYSITNVLETISAKASVAIVGALGVEASSSGAEIVVGGNRFIVGAPCSGIRSIVALLTVASLYAYLVNSRRLVKFSIVLLSIPIALLANVLRISVILLVANFIGLDVAMGIVHYASDLVLFAVAVLSLMGVRRCLDWTLGGTS